MHKKWLQSATTYHSNKKDWEKNDKKVSDRIDPRDQRYTGLEASTLRRVNSTLKVVQQLYIYITLTQ